MEFLIFVLGPVALTLGAIGGGVAFYRGFLTHPVITFAVGFLLFVGLIVAVLTFHRLFPNCTTPPTGRALVICPN